MYACITYCKGACLGPRKANRTPPAGSSRGTLTVRQLTRTLLLPEGTGALNFWFAGYGVKVSLENIAGKDQRFKTELSSPILQALGVGLNREADVTRVHFSKGALEVSLQAVVKEPLAAPQFWIWFSAGEVAQLISSPGNSHAQFWEPRLWKAGIGSSGGQGWKFNCVNGTSGAELTNGFIAPNDRDRSAPDCGTLASGIPFNTRSVA